MSPHLLSINFKDHCDNELNVCQQHQSDLVSYTHAWINSHSVGDKEQSALIYHMAMCRSVSSYQCH